MNRKQLINKGWSIGKASKNASFLFIIKMTALSARLERNRLSV